MKQRARRLPFLHPLCALLVCAPVLALFPAPGCAAARSVATQPATAPARQFHLHLNGIGGYMRIDRAMLIGLREGGFTGEIRPYDWTGADAGLAALTVKRRHAEQSKKVAELIAAEAREHPGARITVTCHSAGAR